MSSVPALEVLELAGQIFVGRQNPADPHKSAHNRDADLRSTLAAENAREHGNALLGENTGRYLRCCPRFWVTNCDLKRGGILGRDQVIPRG